MEKLIKKVEDAIGMVVGLNGLKYARAAQPLQWHLHRGEADIVLHLRANGHLLMLSPLYVLPSDAVEKTELMEVLLEMNHLFRNETFSLDKTEQVIYFKEQANINQKNVSEVYKMIDNFGIFAMRFKSDPYKAPELWG
jgi:hypothetical protein